MTAHNDLDTTLEAIGDELGVTRERVRQIEASALEKLRRACGAQYGVRWLKELDEALDEERLDYPLFAPGCSRTARPVEFDYTRRDAESHDED